MKLNFKQIKPKDINGKPFKNPETITKENPQGDDLVLNIAEEFGNFIYQNTRDVGMLIVSQEIYKNGETEVTERIKANIMECLNAPECPFRAVVKQELITKLNSDELGKS